VSKNRFFQRTALSVSYPSGSFSPTKSELAFAKQRLATEGDWPASADRPLFAFCFARVRELPLRANSRSPLQEEYDSEWDHRSRRLVGVSSPCSWRESASLISALDLSYHLPRTCYHVQSVSLPRTFFGAPNPYTFLYNLDER
jgi:hypothetical protein